MPVTSLQAGDCRITLTRQEREVLHLLLALVRERPDALLDYAAETPAAQVLGNYVARIQAKLPPRGAGTY